MDPHAFPTHVAFRHLARTLPASLPPPPLDTADAHWLC
jgi:hypothetical protein